MRHHAFAAAIGLMTAAILAPGSQSQAASADPTGYWMKPDAERESKIQVFKCGKGKTQLCAKIIWLKDPKDSKGKTLHDVRNEDPSMRDRPIVGLAIFSGLAPSAPATWTGKIYNPEDGHTYSATLTLVSKKQILLRGCKAWLLCGEKIWLRTPAPEVLMPATPPETQIEASADPSATPSAPSGAKAAAAAAASAPSSAEPASSEPPSVEAAAAPTLAPEAEVQAMAEPQPAPQSTEALPKAELATPVAAPADQDTRPGYGFLDVSSGQESAARVTGENVSSMIVMTKPIAAETVAPLPGAPAAATPVAAKAASEPVAQKSTKTAVQSVEPVPVPEQKAKVKVKPVATAAAKPAPNPEATPVEHAAPLPQDTAAVQGETDPQAAETAEAVQAEAALAETTPLSRKQRRILRKQQQQQEPFLPWLR
jgi:uncharacterized protein (DUF2147 family)